MLRTTTTCFALTIPPSFCTGPSSHRDHFENGTVGSGFQRTRNWLVSSQLCLQTWGSTKSNVILFSSNNPECVTSSMTLFSFIGAVKWLRSTFSAFTRNSVPNALHPSWSRRSLAESTAKDFSRLFTRPESFSPNLLGLAGTFVYPLTSVFLYIHINFYSERYWHRSLNPKKLIEVKFSHLSRNMTMQRHLKLYRLPDEVKTSGLRQLKAADIPEVCKLLNSVRRKNIRFHRFCQIMLCVWGMTAFENSESPQTCQKQPKWLPQLTVVSCFFSRKWVPS